MGRQLCLLPLLGLLALGYAAESHKHRTSPGREILCYTSTYDIETLKDSINSCTTLVHQGHDLKDLSTSGIEKFQKSLKDLNPALQFLLSISDNEGSLKTSAQVRLEAAARIVRTLNEVDGVELNVTAGTKERLVHFVQGLKIELVRKSKEKRIVMVLPTKPQDLAKQFDLKGLSKYVDLFTIPTHYLVEEDEVFRTFHPSRLMGIFDMLNTDSLVDLIVGLGVEKRKILVSLPASVYRFTLVNGAENAPRSPTKSEQPVQISRSEMCEAMEQGEWIVERDEDLTAPYAFKDDTWIAFEDKISAGIKGKYVLLRDLAGLGIYNIEKDSKTKCGMSLTEEVYHSFTDNKRKTREAVLTSLHDEIQQKPDSYPSHVKSSEFRIVRVVDTDGHIHANRETMHTEFSCPRQGYFVHPKSCNRFYRCVKFNQGIEDYSVFEFDCPAGLAFDERAEVCVWPGSITEGSACPGSSEIAPSKGHKFTCPEHPGYYADPENCRFFYACYDLGEHGLTSYEFRCPYGLVFDEEKLICEWPYLVPSCGGGTYHRKDYDNAHGSHDSGHGGHSGGGYDETGHGGHGGHGGGGGYDESGHGGHEGHGVHSEGGYDGDGRRVHGGHAGGDYDESGHGGREGHGGQSGGGYDGDGRRVHGGHAGGDYDESGHGEHGGSSGGDYDESGHGGHGGSSGGDYDESSHGHGGSSGGDYDESGHGGHSGSSEEGHAGHGGSSEEGYDGTGHGGHEGSAGGHDSGHGGYDGHTTIHAGHGGSTGSGHEDRHTTIHSGHGSHDVHGGSAGGSYDHSGHGGYDGHTTVHAGHSGSTTSGHEDRHTTITSGHGAHNVHGGSDGGHESGHGGYDGHTTIHAGHGNHDGHGQSTGGGYDYGHTTVQAGHGSHNEHGGSSGGGYDYGHTTVHSGHDGSGHTTIHSGHGGDSHTTIHSGHGGDSHTIIHSGHGGGSHTTIPSGHSGAGHTTIHPGYGDSGHTIHTGHSTGGHSTIHPGYGGNGHTTVTSGHEGGHTHGGSSDEGYTGHTTHTGFDGNAHTTGHVAHGGNGHSTIHPEFAGSVGHGESSGGASSGGHTGHGEGHTTIHPGHGGIGHSTVHTGYEGDVAHGGSSDGGYVNGHSGSDTNSAHGGSSDGGYTVISGAGYDGSSGVSHSTGGENSEYSTVDTGVITGIPSGVYDGHSPVIQYGGQTGSTVSPVVDYGAGSPLISGNAGPTIYQESYNSGQGGGYTYSNAGFNAGSYNDRTSIGGSQGASSSGGTYYNENDSSPGSYPVGISSGSISSGSGSQGLIGTADSTSGTVYSHGDVSGTVVAGANEQGAIATSVVQPGYVQTHSGSPGYVLMNGVKTTYGNYNSKGTFTHGIGDQGVVIAGPPTSGVVLTGHPGAETYLTGQPAPGVIVGGAPGSPMTGSAGEYYNIGGQGSPIYDGSAGHRPQYYPSNLQPSSFPQNPIISVNTDNGYKTNEYHDNGGRSTIRYNNGEITHKYTEDDVREHQSKYGTLPKFDVTTYEMDSTDFTKTGPTKTGIVTAQVGGSATYVSGTSTPKPSINPQNIGAHAFSSNSGYSDTSSKISNGAAKPIPTSPPQVKYTTSRTNYETGRIDGSKINLGSFESNRKQSTPGYTYDKPANQFKNFGIPSTTRAPQSVIKQEIYSSSPAPFLNVHVYNNPSLVTNSPIGYTTGLKENFKTTVFEAAKVPIGTSTVQPVYDTGYKTVISSTQYPINVNGNNFGYSKNTGYRTNSVSTKDNSGLDINVSFQPHLSTQEQYETIAPAGGIESTGYDKPRRPAVTQSVINYQHGAHSEEGNYGSGSFSDYSGTNGYRNSTYTQNAGRFGQKIGSVSSRPVYQSPVVTSSSQVYDAPTSTLASVASVTYRPPFKIVSPQPTPRVPSEGYNYARPSAKFGSTSSSTPKYQNPIIIETESNTKNLGGSRTHVDTSSRTEGGKLVTNYNRGSTRFTPNAYDPYMDTRRGETSVNANQKSYSSNSGQSYSSDVISANDKTVSGYSSIHSTTPDYRTRTQSRDYNRGRISGSEYYRHNEENSDSSSNIASGVSTTYRPISKSSTPGPFRKPSSLQVSYGSTTPAITTYSGSYGRGSSTALYKATTPKPLDSKKGRGKVVVKFSDLHPLLLGKLGAECTCKADPFASFRSGKPLPIESSRGRVDLSNYDESEVYVDLESSKENGDYDDGEYRTPAIADYDSATPSSKNSRIKSQRPSSTYLPGSPSTYLPPSSPTEKPSYSSRFSAASKSSRGSSRASMPFSADSIKALFTSDQRQGGFRAAKSLGGSETSSRNALASKSATSDRSGPGALRGSDDTLEGANNCARPGLFRHPHYCNKFYVCHWDEWKKKFTLHVFDCPVHLTFDNEASACNWPSKGPACQDDNLLV